METDQEYDMTKEIPMNECANVNTFANEEINEVNKDTIKPLFFKPDVNMFLEIQMESKISKLGTKQHENASEAIDQNEMYDATVKPEMVKQENGAAFEIRNNYIILGKGNGNKRYVCSICQERHGTTGNMKHHLLKRHSYVGPPKPIHKCTRCSFGSGQIIKVIQHMKNVHNSKELYSKCHICGYLCEKKFGLLEHIQVIHFNAMKTCEHCDFKAKIKTQIRKHVLTVHKGIELKCRFCAFTYTSLDSMNVHSNQFHSQKSCKLCMETFKGAISLKAHKVIDHKVGKNKEENCESINEGQQKELYSNVNKKLVKIEFVPGSDN